MLNNISWASYIHAVFFIAGLYYIFIGLIFYRKEAVNYYKKFTGRNSFSEKPSTAPLAREMITTTVEVNSLDEVLKSLLLTIKKAASQNFIKEELLQSLNGQIQFYAGRTIDLPQEKINQYIVKTSQEYCSIHLSEEDMKVLWMN